MSREQGYENDTIKTKHPCGTLAAERCYPPRTVRVPRATIAGATHVVRRACPKCGSQWIAVCHAPVLRNGNEYRRIEWTRLDK